VNLYGSGRDPAIMRDIVNLELSAHNVKARAMSFFDAPQCWTFIVRTAFGGRVEQVERLQASMAEKCAVSSCRIDRSDQGLVIQLAKPNAARAYVSSRSLARLLAASPSPRRASLIPIGVTPMGGLAWLDLRSPASPHVAVFGLTGSGKSSLMRWLAWWLALDNQPRLLLASPKLDDYGEFVGTAALLHRPISDEAGFARLLEWLWSEIAARGAGGGDRRPTVVMVDEMPHWLARVARTDEVLEQVAAQGRGLGLHLIMGSQRADEASVGRAAYNAACRIVGKLGSGVYSFATTGRAGADPTLLSGMGDMLMVTPELVRFQAPLVSAIDFERLAWGDNELEMPEPMPVSTLNARASQVDEDAIMKDFAAGRSVRDVMATHRIGHSRARQYQQRWQEAYA
jgi:DNA segregation ATPase FtsK/SpoIIIE-like protein